LASHVDNDTEPSGQVQFPPVQSGATWTNGAVVHDETHPAD
jgi:hypothetical protein